MNKKVARSLQAVAQMANRPEFHRLADKTAAHVRRAAENARESLRSAAQAFGGEFRRAVSVATGLTLGDDK